MNWRLWNVTHIATEYPERGGGMEVKLVLMEIAWIGQIYLLWDAKSCQLYDKSICMVVNIFICFIA